MKKNGFTLIELMAVVIILGAISLIATPLIEQALVNIRQDAYDTQVNNIRQGARQWVASDVYNIPNIGGSTTITLGNLKLAGFVTKDLINPLTKLAFDESTIITITNVGTNGNDKLVYTVGSDSGGQINPNMPTIVLNGDALEYVNYGGTYTEKGVVAKTGAGVIIGYATLIQRGGSTVGSVATNGLYVYTITYSVTDNGFTAKAIRNVIIKDNIPPTFSAFPVDSSILNTVTTFDLMSGVTATDNSAQVVVITNSGNLNLGVVGKYIITYTATDTSGNVTTRQRTITITY